MLDAKFVRDNLEAVGEAARHKGFPFDAQRYAAVFDARLQAIEQTEGLRMRRNEGSLAVKAAREPQARAALVEEMKCVGVELAAAEGALRLSEEELRTILLRTPNVFSADTPIGKDDSENVEVKRVGTPGQAQNHPLGHMELAAGLGLVDFARGTNVAGSRSYFLTGMGARLERAVHSMTLDLLHERGFTQYSIPVLVKSSAMEGTGYLPGGEEQAYFVEKDDLWLVGTSEVSLAAFRSDELIAPQDLPLKMCAHSSCFRREAGAHGKDTKGLYRVHQFQKIEQVVLCAPDIAESDRLHEELLRNAEDVVKALELPYRVVSVCSGDLGLGQVKKHDIEAWMPSRGNYGETHSCSSFYDFQARRLKIRVKDAAGKNRFVYTLNNTAAATPRLLIPLLENHQTPEGNVRIPEALRPYLGGRSLLV
jgi:seryl-tRNA synthetase